MNCDEIKLVENVVVEMHKQPQIQIPKKIFDQIFSVMQELMSGKHPEYPFSSIPNEIYIEAQGVRVELVPYENGGD